MGEIAETTIAKKIWGILASLAAFAISVDTTEKPWKIQGLSGARFFFKNLPFRMDRYFPFQKKIQWHAQGHCKPGRMHLPPNQCLHGGVPGANALPVRSP